METLDISYEVGPLLTSTPGQATITALPTAGQATTAAAPTAGQATTWAISSALHAALQEGQDGDADMTGGAPFDGRMPVNARSAYVENVRYSAVPPAGGTVRVPGSSSQTVHGEAVPARRVRSSPALLEHDRPYHVPSSGAGTFP